MAFTPGTEGGKNSILSPPSVSGVQPIASLLDRRPLPPVSEDFLTAVIGLGTRDA